MATLNPPTHFEPHTKSPFRYSVKHIAQPVVAKRIFHFQCIVPSVERARYPIAAPVLLEAHSAGLVTDAGRRDHPVVVGVVLSIQQRVFQKRPPFRIGPPVARVPDPYRPRRCTRRRIVTTRQPSLLLLRGRRIQLQWRERLRLEVRIWNGTVVSTSTSNTSYNPLKQFAAGCNK